MAGGMDKRYDFYVVLGLKKDCTTAELRKAYKKLALKWHPDRCSVMGNPKYTEEAKKKFQAIQQAYSGEFSAAEDSSKRFLYDLGVYDGEDDSDENGMGDFLNEMASMMSQSNETGNESFEELQQLFNNMFGSDLGSSTCYATPSPHFSSSRMSYTESYCKRNSSEMVSGYFKVEPNNFEVFCKGGEHQGERLRGTLTGERIAGTNTRRNGRKQKISPGQDVSSNEVVLACLDSDLRSAAPDFCVLILQCAE